MIQYQNVSKKYGDDIIAIDDVTFQIDEGEFLFLVGASGSGKTTVIRLLIREEKPTSGKIYFEDSEVSNLRRKHIYNLRRKVGVIFQDFKLIPELTAYENIAFAMEAAGRNDKEIQEKVPYLLEIVGLENRFKSFPYQLSGGEKQRVAIARAMANNPKLLIADEPTGNLDPDSAWDILQILSKINSWGTTVIMSTHESDFVNTLHKRVVKLENGKIIRDDKQGNYFEDLDEFSIKILEKDSEGTIPIVNPQVAQPKEDHKSVPKLEIKKTKVKKKKVQTEDIDEKELLAKAKKIKISEIKFNTKVQKILLSEGYETLADIMESGIGKISEIKGLNDSEIKRIAKVITTFVNNI
jgi:cell division transport system ATP-binding protein